MLKADGFDDAVIGIAHRACSSPIIAYDLNKCVEILMERDGMTAESALEFLHYNTVGAWMGKETPIFIEKMSLDMIEETSSDV